MRFVLCCGWVAIIGCGSDGEDDTATSVTPTQFDVRMQNVSAAGDLVPSDGNPQDIKFAPGIVVIHGEGFELFAEGEAIRFAGFEDLVEDGNNAPVLGELVALDEVFAAESFAALDEDYNSAPMMPGDSAILSVDAEPGARISIAAMFGESNDVFVATPPGGIALFDADDAPIALDLGAILGMYDGGTEQNEEPGLGPNQAPRQSAPGEGEDEGGTVAGIDGLDAAGFAYPAVSDMLSLTATPAE